MINVHCTAVLDETMTELDFINALNVRGPELWACVGPLVVHTFTAAQLTLIENGLVSPNASHVLWSGYRPRIMQRLSFELCAMHWMDLAALLGHRGQVVGNRELLDQSSALLHMTLRRLEWDIKELSNLLRWSRVRLT